MESQLRSQTASRRSSTTSSGSSTRKPSVKSKPPRLQGSPIRSFEYDYLNGNLLEGDEDGFLSESPNTSRQSTRLDLESSRLVIAIDYGTTFTGVAFAIPTSDAANLGELEVIQDWGPQMKLNSKVPSVFSYSPVTSSSDQHQQWGASISEDAVTMVNTKMELDVQDNKIDELELILQVLEGTCNLDFINVKNSRGLPEYSWKDPEDIVTDYMRKIFMVVNDTFASLGSHLISKLAVDFVITVPVNWSYRARNSTFRAIQRAGFEREAFPNLTDIMMITEPEAAAIYTARHLKEDKRIQFLKKNECFILCDAGGGTVDCVSYRVTQLEPTLELEQVTMATSAKCGSSYIDANFKYFLNGVLGDRNYRILDPQNAGHRLGAIERKYMRQIIKKFDEKKRSFPNKVVDVHLDLPGSLNTLNIPGRVVQGELKITHDEMKTKLFDPCINQLIELIQGQIMQVERLKNRVKNVFLVGGFGESQYLQEELKKSLELRKIVMRRPDNQKAWTAVVQGAIIYGVEKSYHKSITFLSAISKSYGIAINENYSVSKYNSADRYTDEVTNNDMANKQLSWLIRRGDLILSNEKRESDKDIQFPFLETNNRKFKMPIYEYPDDDDDMSQRFETGQNELIEVAVLHCDLSAIPLAEFDRLQNPKTKQRYYMAYLVCRIVMSGKALYVEMRWKGKTICSAKIKDVELKDP